MEPWLGGILKAICSNLWLRSGNSELEHHCQLAIPPSIWKPWRMGSFWPWEQILLSHCSYSALKVMFNWNLLSYLKSPFDLSCKKSIQSHLCPLQQCKATLCPLVYRYQNSPKHCNRFSGLSGFQHLRVVTTHDNRAAHSKWINNMPCTACGICNPLNVDKICNTQSCAILSVADYLRRQSSLWLRGDIEDLSSRARDILISAASYFFLESTIDQEWTRKICLHLHTSSRSILIVGKPDYEDYNSTNTQYVWSSPATVHKHSKWLRHLPHLWKKDTVISSRKKDT